MTGVEEDLEDIAATMKDDKTDELSSLRDGSSDHVLPNMTPEVTLSNPLSAVGPFAPRSGISFKTCFITKK